MSQATRRKQKLFLGMTSFQWGVLLLLGVLTCSIVGLLFFWVMGDTTDYGVLGVKLANPSKMILGKWNKFVEPTSTPTLGATPTPIEMKDAFGNTYIVTPVTSMQIRIGCDFGYPPSIEFFEDGTYAGVATSIFTDIFVLQGGQYEILDRDRIKLQTKYGFAVFQFEVDGNKLKLIDDSGCEVVYMKVLK